MWFAYSPWGRDAPKGAVACDGLVPRAQLDLSHWSGNRTPAHLKRDTSVEIAVAFARERGAHDVEVVTNNHFDTDGVLAVWTLLHPELALSHEKLIVSAAEAGDFDEWPGDDRGLWLECAISTLSSRVLGGDAASYDRVLSELDTLVPSIERREDLWGEPYAKLLAAGEDLESGRIEIERVGKIGVISHRPGVSELPGPWISRSVPQDVERVLLAFEQDRGWVYRYELRRWSWAETVDRPPLVAPKRGPIRRTLGPEWIIKGRRGMSGLAYTTQPFIGRPREVAERLLALS